MSQYILMAKIAATIAIIIGATAIGYKAGRNEVLAEQAQIQANAVEAATNAQKEAIEAAAHEAEYWRKIAVHMQQNPITITEWKHEIIKQNPDCQRINGIAAVWMRSKQAAGM